MKIFALLQEPANYTLDLIANVYRVRGVEYAFVNASSAAASQENAVNRRIVPVGALRKLLFFCRILSTHDCLVINGYTGIVCLSLILLNLLLYRRPMALESDTELRIPNSRIRRFLKWLWLHFLFTRRCVYGFAGGNYSHKDLFRHYGMKEDHIFLMPMMVDNSRYQRVAECDDVIVKSPIRFGYVGRLVGRKQVDKIIMALGTMVKAGLDVELVVVGDGDERAKLESIAEGFPVRFTGKLFGPEKIREIQSLDCLVLYSDYEPWGLVVNEALASGVPVIVSDRVGARRDLVEGDAPTGLVARWDDVNDLVEKMTTFARDLTLRKTLSANAVKRMEGWDYALYDRQFDAWRKAISA